MNTLSDVAPVAPASAPVRLSPMTSSAELALSCRDAWRVFVEQSEGWGKAELVLWSFGLYAPIARHVAYALDRRGTRTNGDYRFVDDRFVTRMITIARAKVIEILGSFSNPRARHAFYRAMNDDGGVMCCEDTFGGVGYLPTPGTDALVDRVLALIAADLFANPTDFEGEPPYLSACRSASTAPTHFAALRTAV